MTNRINWIDTARGILIILVVVGHIAYFGHQFANTSSYNFVGKLNFTFLPYYMPAFFIITGLVSNFRIPFFAFLIKNFLSLIVPNVIIGVFLNNWMNLFLSEGLNYKNVLDLDFKQLAITGGGWFLTALFLSKLFYWMYDYFIKKYLFFDLLFFLVLFLSGVFLYKIKFINIWHFQHALILTPFLYVGQKLRENTITIDHHKWIILMGLGLLIFIYLTQYYGYKYPYINSNPYLPLNICILVIPISIIGTMTIFSISKLLANIKWFIIAGKHSLTIYLMHSSISIFLLKQSLFFVNENSSILFRAFVVISIIFVTITLCIFVDSLIDKYIPIIKGKIPSK